MPSESPNATSLRTGFALDRRAEQDHQFGFGLELVSKRFKRFEFASRRGASAGRILVFAHRTGRYGVDMRLVLPPVRAQLKGEQRVFLRQIAIDYQRGLGG